MLVGELHGHPTTERLADDGCLSDVENVKEVADSTGECTQRVVPDGLFGQSVTHEVRRDHGEAISKQRDDVAPGPRATGDAVKEEECGPAALHAVGHVVTVDRDVPDFAFHVVIIAQLGHLGCRHRDTRAKSRVRLHVCPRRSIPGLREPTVFTAPLGRPSSAFRVAPRREPGLRWRWWTRRRSRDCPTYS